jgi:hypothetical protein
MIERVRAVLVTPNGCQLAIRRPEPGSRTQPGDQRRDRRRGGNHQPGAGAGVRAGDERQYFYLGRITSWDFTSRTGPEFAEPGRGSYQLKQIPLTAAGLGAIERLSGGRLALGRHAGFLGIKDLAWSGAVD